MPLHGQLVRPRSHREPVTLTSTNSARKIPCIGMNGGVDGCSRAMTMSKPRFRIALNPRA